MGQNAEILYRSTPQTDVRPSTVGRKKFLLPMDAPDHFAAYGFDVDFDCILDGIFPPAPKNTRANNSVFNPVSGYAANASNAILTDFSQPSDQGGGIGRFTGTFHIVPASWDQFTTGTVTFPGWITAPGSYDARPARPWNVTIRTRYDYFVLDPTGILTSAGVLDSGGNAITRVTSKGAIPILKRGQWLNAPGGVAIANSEVPDLVSAGGAAVGTGVYVETYPSVDKYKLWAAVAEAFRAALTSGGPAWDATHPPLWPGTGALTTYGQYIFQDSVIPEQSYAGNIIQRATSYALFQ